MLDREQLLDSRGATLLDSDGQKVGTIDDIYLDQETDQPEWAVTKTGLLGGSVSFVPLRDAAFEGADIRVPFDKDHIKSAPSMDADGELSQQEEAELYRYYGLEYSEYRSDSGLPEGTGTGVADRGTTDDAMTRSEEELRVGKSQRDVGTARLRKYVVTENVTQTVPVQREEVRVEREPITDANVDPATSGPEISEAEHEVTLTEEQPVVEKRAVPKERVRLSKDTVTDQEQVTEQVRKEQIDTEGDATVR
jgi:uncharacterized protein (TIGR02271 family)